MLTRRFVTTVALMTFAAMALVAGSAPQVVNGEPQQNKRTRLPKQQNPPASPKVPTIPPPTYLYIGFNVIWGTSQNRTAKLVVANNTDATIPKGTTIYWAIIGHNSSNSTAKMSVRGSFPLQVELKPQYSTISPEVSLNSITKVEEKKAWYYK